MTKAKQKANPLPIFWLVISVVLIWMGVGGIKDMARFDPTNTSALVLPVITIVLGGMILGVAVNKMRNSFKAKNGKSK